MWQLLKHILKTDNSKPLDAAKVKLPTVREAALSAEGNRVVMPIDQTAIHHLALEEATVYRRHHILEFQNHWCERIYGSLNDAYTQIDAEIDVVLEKMDVIDLVRREHFYETKIQPLVERRSEAVLESLSREIQIALNKLELNLQFTHPGAVRSGAAATPTSIGDVLEIAGAASPIVAAAGVAGGAASAGVVTTAGIFGLFATSTVSFPVIAAGVIGAAVLGGLGIVKVGDLTNSYKDKFRMAIKQGIFGALIYSNDDNAMVQKMQGTVYKISQQLLSHAGDHAPATGE